MNEQGPSGPKKTLEVRQTWFLWAMALAVVLVFAFVIVPYLDPQAPKVSGQVAVDFDLEILGDAAEGDRIRLSDLRGKTVVLDFWASWCRPCREQSAVLQQIVPQLGSEVYLLGIATSDKRSAAQDYLKAEKLPYPNVFDEAGDLAEAYRVVTLPTLVIVDPQGVIRSAGSRVFGAVELLALIRGIGRKAL